LRLHHAPSLTLRRPAQWIRIDADATAVSPLLLVAWMEIV
jgi:hypothetical protein